MKNFTVIILWLFVACQSPKQGVKELPLSQNEGTIRASAVKTEESPEQLEKLTGDFDGDGKPEEAHIVQTQQQEGNPVEAGTSAEYAIEFTTQTIPVLKIQCCAVQLVKEGDLNGDGREELSVFQAPENGNTYQLTTYTFEKDQWQELMEPLLIPVIDQGLTLDELQGRVYREADKVFIQEVDVNSDKFQLVKKEVKLKN